MPPIPTPPHWGRDNLSEFATKAFSNEMATFVQETAWYSLLVSLDATLKECAGQVMREVVVAQDEPIGRLLFLQAHSQYIATARSAAAGHCAAVFPVGRAAVEAACYAWHIIADPSAAQRWQDKSQDRDALRIWNREFSFGSICREIGEQHAGTATWARYIHQTAIDHGAHPNQHALFGNMVHVAREDGGLELGMTYLHGWGLEFLNAAKFAVEVGMLVVRLFELALPLSAVPLQTAARLTQARTLLSALIEVARPMVEAELRGP
ncbi:hypothetical protein [Cupriavidus sp. IK-TO18]|uniref:hypothetical protein n=1 Tax=Cupriavidus sp. IK-TO18 TaxID=2782182 RepID=UPI00189A6900|nr:hypothetical protein [Cupriavidus sp. IK-TO18]MBF6989421.1 hypothetical protein [Cupriavidus sp. IK-TO18]